MLTTAPHDATVPEDDEDVMHLRLSVEGKPLGLAEDTPFILMDADQTFVRPYEDPSYY
jgi:hypothetical protein